MSASASKETRDTFVLRLNSPTKPSRPGWSRNMEIVRKEKDGMGDSELPLKPKPSAFNANTKEGLPIETQIMHERCKAGNTNEFMAAQVRAHEIKVTSGERKHAQRLDEHDDLWATRNNQQTNDIHARKEAAFFEESAGMTKDKSDLREENVELKNAKEKAERVVVNPKNCTSQLSAAADTEVTDIQTLRSECDGLEAERQSLTAATVVICEERDQLAVMLTESHANIKALNDEKSAAAWGHMTETGALDVDKQKLDTENKKLKADKEQVQEDKEELEAEKADLLFDHGILLRRISLIKGKEAEVADRLKQMQGVVIAAVPDGDGWPYTEPYQPKRTEFPMLDKALFYLDLVIERTAAEKKTLLSERDELRATVNQSAEEVEALTIRLHSQAAEKQKCQIQCLKMVSAMKKAQNDLASITAEYAMVREDRDSARAGEQAACDLIKQRDAAIRVLCHEPGVASSAEKAVAHTVATLSAEKQAAITAMEHAISQEKRARSFQRKTLEDLDKAKDVARDNEAVSLAQTSLYEANLLALKKEMVEARHEFREKIRGMIDEIGTVSAAKVQIEAELKMYKEDGGVIALDD